MGVVELRLNDPQSIYNINEVFGITNGSILRASKSQIYKESPSIIIKRNLVIVNVFCQSLGPSLYRASTVEHSPNLKFNIASVLHTPIEHVVLLWRVNIISGNVFAQKYIIFVRE